MVCDHNQIKNMWSHKDVAIRKVPSPCDPQTKELLDAIESADLSRVQLCITKGANVNNADSKTSPLYSAVSIGHTEIVKLLLESGADINQCTNGNKTLLVVAAEKGHKRVVQQLIAADADVNKYERYGGMTPLGMAALQGHLEIIKILLQSGADINMYDGSGNPALAHAAQKKANSHVIQHLLSMGAYVNRSVYGRVTPLMLAAKIGFIENVKTLVESGADINFQDSKGKTAVDYALMDKKNNDHISAYFKNKLVAKESKKTRKALFDCIQANNLEMAITLIANEANVNKPQDDGETPLAKAVKIGNLKMIRLLLNNGAQFSIPSAFLTAIKTNNMEIVQLLIKRGADVNLQYKTGNTPLLQAIEIENLEIVKLLLENGAADDIVNHPFLLIRCVEERNFELVKQLIEKGAHLDFVSASGFTPLTKCVEVNSYRLLEFLVQSGANVNKADKNKNTALSLAALNADLKTFDYLLKAGADLEQVKEKLDEVAKNNEDFAVYLKSLQKQKIEKGHKEVTEKNNLLPSGGGSNQEGAPL